MNEEAIGSELKHQALRVMNNLAVAPTIRSIMYSDDLMRLLIKVVNEENIGSDARKMSFWVMANLSVDPFIAGRMYTHLVMNVRDTSERKRKIKGIIKKKDVMKVVNEENIGSEVKKMALWMLGNVAVDAAIAAKMYSDALLKVG